MQGLQIHEQISITVLNKVSLYSYLPVRRGPWQYQVQLPVLEFVWHGDFWILLNLNICGYIPRLFALRLLCSRGLENQ